jgi:hypothetical protein
MSLFTPRVTDEAVHPESKKSELSFELVIDLLSQLIDEPGAVQQPLLHPASHLGSLYAILL